MWHVEHRLETTASPAAVWRRWAEIQDWPNWDSLILWVRFSGVLILGSQGIIKYRSGETLNFQVTECTPGRAFTCQARTLGTIIRFRFRLDPSSLGTRLTHIVEIRGPLAWLLSLSLGRRIREALPAAARKLAQMAAQSEAPPSPPPPHESRGPEPLRKGLGRIGPSVRSGRPGKPGGPVRSEG